MWWIVGGFLTYLILSVIIAAIGEHIEEQYYMKRFIKRYKEDYYDASSSRDN